MGFIARLFGKEEEETELPVEEYAIGRPFPRKRRQQQDGCIFSCIGDCGPCLISYYSNPTPAEIAAWQSGMVELGLTKINCVIYILGKFGPNIVEADYSIHLQGDVDLEQLLVHKNDQLQLFLVDANTNIVQAMRSIQLPPYFSQQLWQFIAEQYAAGEDREGFARVVREVREQTNVQELFQLAPTKMYVPSTAELEQVITAEKTIMNNPVVIRDNGAIDILITKQDVDNNRLEEVVRRFKVLLKPAVVGLAKQHVNITFCGYAADAREPYEIEEVARFVEEVDKYFPYWFYFMRLETSGLRDLCYVLCRARRFQDGKPKVARAAMNSFLEKHLLALDSLFNSLQLPTEEQVVLRQQIQTYFFGK